VAVDPVGLPFGGLAMAGVFLLIAVMAQLPPPLRAVRPASKPSWSGRLNSKDNGANRSESDERGDAGWACAPAGSGLFRWTCWAYSPRNGCRKRGAGILPIELFDGLLAARAVLLREN
jgi:hypothetical protein